MVSSVVRKTSETRPPKKEPPFSGGFAKKEPPFPAALKLITGRRQTE
jgi:hypothetical protein